MSHHLPEDQSPEHHSLLDSAEILQNPYSVLGLTPKASTQEIKQAYFTKVREFPPERAPEQFKRIRGAYDALRTAEARAATDLFLLHNPPPYQPYKRPPAFNLQFDPAGWIMNALSYTNIGQGDLSADFNDIDL